MPISNVFNWPLLSLLVFVPLVGALAIAFIPRRNANVLRGTALVLSVIVFIWSLQFYVNFNWADPGMQFVNRSVWIAPLGIQYLVGLDGISMPLVLLTTLLTAVAIGASWTIGTRLKEYMIAFLVLETGMLGVFAALDLFLFFIFFEAVLIPMYIIIGVWGGPRRVYAANKFILFTMAGSALMLVAILAVGLLNARGGVPNFDWTSLTQTPMTGSVATLLFFAFALAFAIKVPMWPLHTWLPDAHVEAPTAGSIILAGVLLKMGTYGLLRFNLPLFPQASRDWAWLFAALGVIGIIYGAWVAYAQTDAKKLVAYSSVSHMGFIVLGIFALNAVGISGSVLYMVGHGINTGALFLLVGYIYERRHTRELSAFGGLWKVMPVYGVIFLIAMFASVGLPGLSGFVGEFLTLQGAFLHNWVWAAFGALGVILSAIYLMWMFQRIFFGPVDDVENHHLSPLTRREILVAAPLIILMFVLGVFPNLVLGPAQPAVAQVVQMVGQVATALKP
ncbi:MAG: NADH-quinone oxidoreductase subunit M [Anaerolineae bacterium]|nr:NADH-quinone oxidoreductase subunit M [Anaerolineae bacterium]